MAVGAAALALTAGIAGAPRLGGAAATGEPAQDGCREHVLADWSDDGVVQGVYPLLCYRQAIRALPEDVRVYSSAVDEIWRAMSDASHGKRRATATAR